MDKPISLQNGFWPSIRIAHAVEDEFIEKGDVREEYGEDDHLVGHRCDCPPPSFQIGRDLYASYFVVLRPCDRDDCPFWIARAMSDPNSNPERPNTVQIQFFRPVLRNRNHIFNKMRVFQRIGSFRNATLMKSDQILGCVHIRKHIYESKLFNQKQ